MKKYKYLFLLLYMLGCAACYEDESTVNYKWVNPIVIDLGSMPENYTLFSLDTLTIQPIVYKEGVVDTSLRFTWTIQGNLIQPTVIGHQMTLKACITCPAESNPYKLVFDVEDLTTGLHAEEVFDINVSSAFGSGLLVADTKDGRQGDVSLIMGYNFTSGMKKEQDLIQNDLFSRINGYKLEGKINDMSSRKYGVTRNITLLTPSEIVRVDPFNFGFMDRNEEMFYVPPKTFNAQKIGFISNMGVELIAMNGKIYPRSMQQYNKYYSFYLLTTDMRDYSISQFCTPQWEDGLAFDDKNGRLLQFDGSRPLEVFNSAELAPDAPFDHNALQDFFCKAMFTGYDNTLHTILQNKATGHLYSYVTQRDAGWPDKNNGKPLRIIDLNGCPHIREAIGFVSSETQSVIYYATRTTVYSVYYRGEELIVTPEYTTPENNEITILYVWKSPSYEGRVDYTNPDPTAEKKVISTYSKDRMIVLATYDSQRQEGFIRTVAIATVGSGTLEKNRELHGEYGGFGHITAITEQEK